MREVFKNESSLSELPTIKNKEYNNMGLTAKPFGKFKSEMKKLENELAKKEEERKNTKNQKSVDKK